MGFATPLFKDWKLRLVARCCNDMCNYKVHFICAIPKKAQARDITSDACKNEKRRNRCAFGLIRSQVFLVFVFHCRVHSLQVRPQRYDKLLKETNSEQKSFSDNTFLLLSSYKFLAYGGCATSSPQT